MSYLPYIVKPVAIVFADTVKLILAEFRENSIYKCM